MKAPKIVLDMKVPFCGWKYVKQGKRDFLHWDGEADRNNYDGIFECLSKSHCDQNYWNYIKPVLIVRSLRTEERWTHDYTRKFWTTAYNQIFLPLLQARTLSKGSWSHWDSLGNPL
jgi:hypothetical protein